MMNKAPVETHVRQDLLERGTAVQEPTVIADLGQTNRLLMQLLAETQKQVAKVAVEARVVFGYEIAPGIRGADFDIPALVRFYYSNNPVKSLYTVIANSSKNDVMVAINEPSVNLGLAVGNGIYLAAKQFIVLPALEIENLSVRVAAAATNPTPINVITGTNGMLSIYGWTLRQYSNITE